MSAVKFYFDEGKLKAETFLTHMDKRSKELLGKHAVNAAVQIAEAQSLYWSKYGLYKLLMGKPVPVTAKELLTMDLLTDQYGKLLRNAVVFRLSPGVDVVLEDVKLDYYKENTIVSTPMIGRRGTIKEFVQGGDYNITITGSLFSKQDKPTAFPIKQLKSLVEVMSMEDNVEIANVQLNELDVTRVVVKRFDIMQTKFVNTCGFRLTLISDEDYKLDLD